MNDLHYAVVVGIDSYPGLGDLAGARADALDFKEWLLDPDGGGLPEGNVRTVMFDERFSEPEAARPRADEIVGALTSWNVKVRKKTDRDQEAFERSRLYLFVAGHGFTPRGGKVALLTANVDRAQGLYWNVDLSDLGMWYQGCAPFRELVVFTDCCRENLGATGIGAPWPWCDPSPQRRVRYALGMATSPGGFAYEPGKVDEPRGIFTRALMDGLRGGASKSSGVIDHYSLQEYVYESVLARTRQRQEATTTGEWERAIVFRESSQPRLAVPERTLRVHFPPGFAEPVELLAEDGTYLDRWDEAPTPWKRTTREGRYQLRAAGAGDLPPGAPQAFKVLGVDHDEDFEPVR